MDLEQDYLVYALEVSLTFLAISAAYLIDVSRPATLLMLLPVTILFGYTAFVSKDGFKTHSLLSLLGLGFVMLGGIVAVVAVVVAVGNVLVSVFASGEGFRNFYGATSLPLLFTGLILGGSIYGLAVTNPSVASTIQGEVADYAGQQAETMVNRSNMLESRKGGQARLVNATSQTTFRITRGTVLQEMGQNNTLNTTQYAKLEEAFDRADSVLDKNLREQTTKNIQESSVDISARVADLIRNTLKGKAFLLLIPAVAFGLYGMHPVVGIITAIWASLFSAINVRVTSQTDSKELDTPPRI